MVCVLFIFNNYTMKHFYLIFSAILCINIFSAGNLFAFSGEGSGTEADPYQITTVEQLQEMNDDLTAHYVLMNDIDADITSEWNGGKGFTPIGYEFTGSLDGQGYSIMNLYSHGVSAFTGLFQKICEGAVVSNLNMVNMSMASPLDDFQTGGIASDNYGLISNITVSGQITATHTVGAITGQNFGEILNCQSSCQVGDGSVSIGAGGIAYNNRGLIQGCSFSDTLKSIGGSGGVAAVNRETGSIISCYSNGTIDGDNGTGGLLGANQGVVRNCYATGSVCETYETILNHGGFVGFNEGEITDCYSTGKVYGRHGLGGFVGKNTGSGIIKRCFSTGEAFSYGGFTGYDQPGYGGFVGQNSAMIESCSAFGSVTANTPNQAWLTGGFAGYNTTNGTINNCYSFGDAMGTCVGGFTGYNNEGTITNCYSLGAASGNNEIGGFVGLNNAGTIRNCFWNIETSGLTNSDGGTGKTTAELKNIVTFTSTATTGLDIPWDYVNNPNDDTANEDIWGINSQDNDGYPFLSWEGYPVSAPPTSGDGSEGNPYQLATLDELFWITQNPDSWDKHFIQMGDIDAAETVSWDDSSGLKPIGYTSPYFTGSYDGNGFAIKNLTINRPDQANYTGLFGIIGSGAEVNNLTLSNVNITGDMDVGGMAGKNSGSINKCIVKGSITGNKNVGGLAGNNWGPVNECYSEGAVSANEIAGGLLGFNSADINNCYSIAEANTNNGRAGGLIGELHSGTIQRCYATGYVTGVSDTGGVVGYHSGGNVYYTYWDKETTGQVTDAALPDTQGKTTEEMKIIDPPYTYQDWNFDTIWAIVESVTYPFFRSTLSSYFAGGNGTEENPYQIGNAEQLQNMWKDPYAHYELINDIDASATSTWNEGSGFHPVGNDTINFEGSLNGNEYIISDLFINRPDEDYIGLIGYQAEGSIKNLILENVDITGNYRVGGIAGGTYLNTDSIMNCGVSGNITGNDSKVGGLVGQQLNGVISNCYVSANVEGSHQVGGLVGENYTTIENSYARGQVGGTHTVGGLTGIPFGHIENCYATCKIASSGKAGGLHGEYPSATGATVNACFWDTITSGLSVGYGGTGLSTAEMKMDTTFLNAGWDFMDETENGTHDNWGMNFYKNDGYPFLAWQGYENLSGIIYVDSSATGNNDGSSWQNAFTSLQDALQAAGKGSEIWIAEGIYYPDNGTGITDDKRDTSFVIPDSVTIYGGFNGTETSPGNRNWETNKTILSGDIGVEGDSTDNSYHVVRGGSNILLDGLIIEKGNADGTDDHSKGAGMYHEGDIQNINISNCIFRNNHAANQGGAIKIHDNISTDEDSIQIDNSLFYRNTAYNGAALNTSDAQVDLAYCSFVENTATRTDGLGSTVWYWGGGSDDPTVRNCTFTGNSSYNGAAIHCRASQIHCTVKNSIFYDQQQDAVKLTHGANASVYYSRITQEGYAGTNHNIPWDPMFADTTGIPLVLYDQSPCIDAGDPASPNDPDDTRANMGNFHPVTLTPLVPEFTIQPEVAGCGTEITFDATSSYANEGHSISSYEWDFDYDAQSFNVQDTGSVVTHQYTGPNTLGDHIVALRLTGDSIPQQTFITVDTARMDFQNYAPVANAGGPYYSAWIDGQFMPVTLIGSASHDPNMPCDSIVSYTWDTDNDGLFGEDDTDGSWIAPDADGTGDTLEVVRNDWQVGLSYALKLKVEDSYGTVSDADEVILEITEADDYPPTIQHVDMEKWVKGPAHFEFTVSHPTVVQDTFACSFYVNGQQVQAYDSLDNPLDEIVYEGGDTARLYSGWFDSQTFADGSQDYQLKVELENEAQHTSEKVSGLFGIDNTPPQLVVQDVNSYLDINGTDTLQYPDIILNAEDNMGEVSDTLISDSVFTCQHEGTAQEVEVEIFDPAGNSTAKTSTVTVLDTLSPTLILNNPVIELNAEGNATLGLTDLIAHATDNCSLADTSLSGQTSYSCADVGSVVNVDITVEDASGNPTTKTAEINVVDNISPALTVQDVTVYLDEAGNASISAGSMISEATDNCSLADTSLSGQTSYSPADAGSDFEIEVTVADASGNQSTDKAWVHVLDTIAPALTVQDVTVYLDEAGNASITAADIISDAADNCALTDTILSGQSDFSCSDAGSVFNMEVTVKDASGNQTTNQTNISVLDTIMPVITCPDNQTVEANGSGTYTINGNELDPVNAGDNCSYTMINDHNNEASLDGATLSVGTNTIMWIITDGTGNKDSCSFNVEVTESVGISYGYRDEIVVYPNPTNGKLTIEVPSLNEDRTIQVMDVTGSLMFIREIKDKKMTMDLSSLPSGIYYLKIYKGDKLFIGKIMKR